MKILILIAMIMCHIVDDYYLQGILASMKQKEWWKANAPNPLYKYDYLMALFMHSFSWAFSIMLIPILYILIIGGNLANALILFMFNVVMHMIIDDAKANQKSINLIIDQSLHIFQIVVTWFCLVV